MTRTALAGLVFIVGCAAGEASSTFVRLDSLPGGVRRTMSSHPVDSGRWHLVAVRDVQPPELDSAELANPQDLAIGDDGTLFVVEPKPAVIKVFDKSGRLIRTIGREGDGPGEFRSAYIAVRGDTLVVQDARNSRATSFNWRTGAVLSERRTACCYYSPIGIDSTGHVAVRSIKQPPDSTLPNAQTFVRFPLNGTSADTIYIAVNGNSKDAKPWLVREGNRVRMGVVVPFQPRAFHIVDPVGRFVTAFSTEYMLRRSTDGRDTVALFGRDWSPTTVSMDEKKRITEQRIAEVAANNAGDIAESTIRAAFDPTYIPDVRPAFEGVWVDGSGRTWVRLGERDTTRVYFDLFDADGRWLDALSVPATDWPKSPWIPFAAGKQEIAVPLEGADGRPLVRVFRIERR
jgi:hypothetical protein